MSKFEISRPFDTGPVLTDPVRYATGAAAEVVENKPPAAGGQAGDQPGDLYRAARLVLLAVSAHLRPPPDRALELFLQRRALAAVARRL